MKKNTLLSIALLFLVSIGFAQTAPKAVQDSLLVILKETQTDVNAPSDGAIVTVNKIGAWQWNGGSGLSNVAKKTKATGTERFRIGSVTKTFIATSILKLVSQNKLKLDDNIGKYLTPTQVGYIPNAPKITIRQLLHHTSGIADVVNDTTSALLFDYFSSGLKQKYTFDELLSKYLVTLKPTHSPDNKTFAYCNTGFMILGEIIKKASGSTWQDYITQNIITPLKLSKTSCPADADSTISGVYMHGYTQISATITIDVSTQNVSWANSAGAMISTTDDLNTFMGSLLKGLIIPKNWVDTMTTFSVKENNFVSDGFGIFKVEAGPYKFYGHTGGIPGYSTLMFFYPKYNTIVTANFNSDNADFNTYLLRLSDYLETLPPTVATKDLEYVDLISIAPNPTDDFIRINNKTTISTISIMDMQGRVLYRNDAYENNSPIDVSLFKAGIYFTVIDIDGVYVSKKFVKL